MNCIRKKVIEKKGFTLIELIVTFALMSIFMGAAVLLTTSFFKIFTRTNDIALAQNLGDTLTELIDGEVGAALDSTLPEIYGEGSICISDGNGQITYYNKDGFIVQMYVKDGRLILHYQETEDANHVIKNEAVEWRLEDGVYTGNDIESLSFELQGGEDSLILMKIKLKSGRSDFIYETEHMIECRNVDKSHIKQS